MDAAPDVITQFPTAGEIDVATYATLDHWRRHLAAIDCVPPGLSYLDRQAFLRACGQLTHHYMRRWRSFKPVQAPGSLVWTPTLKEPSHAV